MPTLGPPAQTPPQLESAALQISTLACLLQCTDPALWDTLARPSPKGLAALLFRAHADMGAGLEELDLPIAS